MNKSLRNSLVTLAAAFFCVAAYADGGANTGYSPYSKFGIGRLARRGTAYSQTMGGVGVATRNTRFINTLNPAAVTARDSLAFMADFSLTQENAYYRQHTAENETLKSVDNTFGLNNIVMSFPIWRSSAFMVGINPYSGLGYNFTETITDENIIGHTGNVTDLYSGTGSLHEIFVGAGVTFWKRLSLGAQMNVYLGNLEKVSDRSFTSSVVASVFDYTTIAMRGINGKFGLQYEQPIKGDRLNIGATYKMKTSFSGDARKMRYTLQSSYTDTLGVVSNINLSKISLPSEISVGISYTHRDVWSAEMNYTRSDWRNNGMDTEEGFAQEGFKTALSQSYNVGFEYTPNRNDIRYYMRNVTYRAGAYYSEDYYTFRGNKVSAYAVTLGMTLPVFRWSNGVTLGMEIGRRGKLTDNMVRETFMNFSIGFNIYDIWFIKPKYD